MAVDLLYFNPHFLFNSLNNIYSLAVNKSEDTPNMILKLSELLRYVIYKGQEKKVYLNNEIQHIIKYIELFKMRSEDNLDVNLSIEGQVDHVLIKPLMLISIIEECFNHSDFENGDAFMEILLNVSGHNLSFTIRSNRTEEVGGEENSEWRWILNRIKQTYPDQHSLQKLNTIIMWR